MTLLPSWRTVLAGIIAGVLIGGYTDHIYMAHKIDKLVAEHNTALATANAANLKKQVEMQDEVDTLNSQKVIDDEKAAKNLESVRTAARAGNVGMSIPSSCGSNTSKKTGVVSKASTEERTDLLPGTVDDILRIAGHAAQDVRDYNDLLEQYNAVCK